MARRFDLVVVGTGVTSAVASRCREAGWTVAVVDSRPFSYISFEFAHVAARAGAEVTIVHRGARPLEGHRLRRLHRSSAGVGGTQRGRGARR
jgi:pyruvate/2-oxoglutarate dehydrogenase complex dihydrolipoamide dehydrogenase (E3) component